MRTLLVACIAIVVFAGCGGGGSSTPAASTASTGNASSSTATSGGSIDPCKLTEAEVQAVAGFAVTKAPNISGEPGCTYDDGDNDPFCCGVIVTAYEFPSQKDADVIRDGNTGERVDGVAGAIFDTGTFQMYLYRGTTQLTITLSNQKLSLTELKAAQITLVKKF